MPSYQQYIAINNRSQVIFPGTVFKRGETANLLLFSLLKAETPYNTVMTIHNVLYNAVICYINKKQYIKFNSFQKPKNK